MDKDFNKLGNNSSDNDKDNSSYNEEMSRQTVGKLISGLDDDVSEPEISPAKEVEKPVVRAVRLNSQKANREKISNSFYDEDRTNTTGDEIVTGFKEPQDEPQENDVTDEDNDENIAQDEEDPADTVRIRRPNILKDEPDEELDSRERYRRQFLEGYTDHERKRLDLGSDMTTDRGRRTAPDTTAERPLKKRNEVEPDVLIKKPAQENVRRSREERSDEQRPRRRPSDEEAGISSRRAERKERPAQASGAATQPSYSAPIFKILALLFLILICVIVFLAVSLNSANNEIDRLEASIEQFDDDVDELAELRLRNVGLEARNETLVGENHQLQSEIEDLNRRIQVQDTPAGSVPGPIESNGDTPVAGTREHVVQPGETLYRISTTHFGHARAIDAIMQANNLTNDSIQPTQRLIIPATY